MSNLVRDTAQFACLPKRTLAPGARQRIRVVLESDVPGDFDAGMTVSYEDGSSSGLIALDLFANVVL